LQAHALAVLRAVNAGHAIGMQLGDFIRYNLPGKHITERIMPRLTERQ
jgi:hypothetical protein